MKPYLAIMIDSVWEAVTNKILWGLIVCWSLLLGGLAPFGYVTEVGYRLTRGDIMYTPGLAQKLAKGLTPQGSERQKAISSRLGESLKKQLTEANNTNDSKQRNDLFQTFRSREGEVVKELNKLLDDRDLFQADVFDTVASIETLKPIIAKEKSKRSKLEVEQLNRYVLSRTYSAELTAPRNEQIWIGYAGIKIGNQLPLERSQINIFVETVALQLIIRLGLSFVVVFVGLIITSSMIPETFRSGSLHLLLSKPVSRPLIYLTKFFGGTLFVLINIAYLLIGLYLLVGWRLGIWNVGLIWCIPLLLFVFTIFYSVSALVGLIWNNPILCVVVCIVFWIFCLTIGVLESGMRMPAVWLPQIVRFAKVNDELLAVTQSSEVKVWNEKFQVWQPAAEMNSRGPGRVLGPLVNPDRTRLIMRSDSSDGMGGMETRYRNFVMVDLDRNKAAATQPAADVKADAAASPPTTFDNSSDATKQSAEKEPPAKKAEPSDDTQPENVDEARRKPRWNNENGPEPPMLMIDLINLGGKTIVATRNGFFEFDWNAQELSDATKNAPSIFGDLSGWLNRMQPQTFRDLTPDNYVFGESVRVTSTPDGKSLILYNSDTVQSLKLDDSGKLVVEHSLKIGESTDASALIAASNSFVVIGREEKPLLILDRQLSKIVAELPRLNRVDPRQIQVIGTSERFSIVDHSDRLSVLDPSEKQLRLASCPHQGAITGITWMNDDEAWVAIRPNRAMLWNMKTGAVDKTLTPAPSKLDLFYNWIARPLYMVSPKPSSLNGVLQKLLQRDRAGQTQLFNNDIAAFRIEIEVWQPIFSNLIFVTVLLGIGCIYVWRREF